MPVTPFPPGFHTEEIETNGATIHVRVGGQGRRSCCCTASATPATCGRRWPRRSAQTTRSIVPDLRGMGLSAHPDGGYDKKNAGAPTSPASWTRSKIEKADLVTHDIGNMVGYALRRAVSRSA